MALNDLPDDCLLHVFDYFEADDLLTLSAVCTRWNELIQTTKYLKKLNITNSNYKNIRLENVKSAKIKNPWRGAEIFLTPTNSIVPRFTSNLAHLEIAFLPTQNMIAHLRSIKLPSLTLTLYAPVHVYFCSSFWNGNRELRRLKVRLATGGYLYLRNLPDTLTTFVASNVHVDARCFRHCSRLTCVKIKALASNFNFPLSDLKTLKLGYSRFLPSAARLEHFVYTDEGLPSNIGEFLAECRSTLERFDVPHFRFDDKTLAFPRLKHVTADGASRGSFPNLKNLTLHSYEKSDSAVETENLERLNVQNCTLSPETEFHSKKFSKLKTFELSNDDEYYTPLLLKRVNPGLKELTIFNSTDLRANLTEFVELQSFSLKSYFESDVTISLPKSLNRMTVIGHFKLKLKGRVNLTELRIKVINENYLDAATLRRCLSGLRILELYVLLSDPLVAILKILKVLKTHKRNDLFAIYVQRAGKPYEKDFRRACPKLEIFDCSWQ